MEELLLSDNIERSDNYEEIMLTDKIGTLSVDNNEKVDDDDNNNDYLLEILTLGPVFMVLVKLIQGYDIFTFLSTCKFLVNCNAWDIIIHQLEIPNHLLDLLPPEMRSTTRLTTLFVVNQLGFACSCCLKPLDGREGSLFACTTLCKTCSLKKFIGSDFVEGTIKFYLSGLDSVTIKGLAFLQYPYFVCTDEDVKTKIEQLFGSAFEVSIAIYQEKEFFRIFAPKGIKRPRDDKAKTLRAMVDAAEDIKKNKKNLLSFSFSKKDLVVEEKELPWINCIPNTLMTIYQNEIKKRESGESLSIPLGALPLRDLVKTMFEKDSALIKKLN